MKKKVNFLLASVIIIVITFSLIFITSEKRAEKSHFSGAYEALEFWTHSRAYPQDDIPIDKYYQAFEYNKAMLQNLVLLEKISTWEPMGPSNVGGRMISVAVNPLNSNTLYSGSASGGLWRTYDATNGTNWHRIQTGFPTLGVMAIAIHPADTNTIYIGTGEVYGYQSSIGGLVNRTTRGSYGFGILKTTDGGLTWSLSLDWTIHQERGIQCIRINPQNPNSIYAAATEGIYKSTNAGASWQLVLPVLMGEDIVIHPNDTTKIIVSCGNLGTAGSGIYRSLDGGGSWNQVTGIPSFNGKTLLEMFQSNPDIVYASVANYLNQIGLYKTTNFGDSWTVVHTQEVCDYQGWFSHWVAVHPTNANLVIHAGVYMYKSTDGGSTVNYVSGIHVDHHNYAHDPNNPDVIYVANDGGIYRSSNFGDSYQNLEFGLQTAQFYKGFSNSTQDSMLAMGGLQDNSTVIYRGTSSWSNVIGGDGCWTAINTFNDNIMYGEYQSLSIHKSIDRGYTFNSAWNGLNQTGPAFVAPFVISPSSPNILYSGIRSVFKTTNNANLWFETAPQLDGNPILTLAVSPNTSDIVYAATAPRYSRARIFRTINGGSTWTNVTGNLPDRYPMDLIIDPHDNQTVYVTFAGYGSGHVFQSKNAGNNWTDISNGLPDVPTLAIEIDPAHSGYIYVGNDLGVYVTSDTGNTWNTFMNGLPEAAIAMDLNISISNRNLWVATHGNGAYKRPLVYQMMYASGVDINSNFMLPNIDSLIVNTQFINPANHNFSSSAIIISMDSSYSDSIPLFDDGNHGDGQAFDGIFGCFITPISFDNNFMIGIGTLDLDLGGYLFQNDMQRFTTVGPVVVDSFFTSTGHFVLHPGDSIMIKLMLKNEGLTTSARLITADVTSNSPCVKKIYLEAPNYGTIAPGQIATTQGVYHLVMNDSCPNVSHVKFDISIDSDYYTFWYDSIFFDFDPISGIEKRADRNPLSYSLKQNYPNPFNPITNIQFLIPKAEFVTLKIYNLLGQEVATLVSDKLTAGNYTYIWDASDFASGVYYYKIQAGDLSAGSGQRFIQTRKKVFC